MIPLDKVLALAGVSASSVTVLTGETSIRTVDELAQAARAHRLRDLPGLNISLEYHILRCIKELRSANRGILMDVAHFQAAEVKRWLAEIKGVEQAEIVGELRRGMGLVTAVEVLAATSDPAGLIQAFTCSPLVGMLKEKGKTRIEVASSLGLPVTLHVVEPDRFGAALLNMTGSQAHLLRLREMANRQGLSLDTILAKAGSDEEEIYRQLDLPFIPPELREGQGEIEAARAGRLPQPITAEKIQGDLHMHTNWADGLQPIEAMAEAARARGYRYIAICDHSPLIEEAGGLDQVRLVAQSEEIAGLNRQYSDFSILSGMEVDIRTNGELDMPDDALRELDLAIASIHIPYEQDSKMITERLIAAMQHPLVDILAHPAGRLLKEPNLYEADVEELLRAAIRTGTVLEINSGPDRLDLSAEWARRAREYGVDLVIGSDAHSVQQLGWMQFGLATARRAWLEEADVLNTFTLEELRCRLKRHQGTRHLNSSKL